MLRIRHRPRLLATNLSFVRQRSRSEVPKGRSARDTAVDGDSRHGRSKKYNKHSSTTNGNERPRLDEDIVSVRSFNVDVTKFKERSKMGAKQSFKSVRAELDILKKHSESTKVQPKVTTTDAGDQFDAIRKIIAETAQDPARSSKKPFFDPENKTLNLTLSNKVLFKQIFGGTKDRMDKRYGDSSKAWLQTFHDIAERLPAGDSKLPKYDYFKKKIQEYIVNATISPEVGYNAISIGDIVMLQEDNVNFYMLVKCPTSLNSQAYVFIDNRGEIIHASKSSIKIRFPSIIPKEYHELIESLVQLETKYLDIAPIGTTDEKFSKSVEALPLSLRDKHNTDAFQNEELMEGEGFGNSSQDDFLVAQASSQLLTNTNVNTFHVPLAARELYSKALTDLSIQSFNEMSEVNAKLELLHRKLQYDENDDLINIPRSISMFEILYLMEEENFSKIKNPTTSTTESPISWLGKQLKQNIDYDNQTYPISRFLALVLALRKQSRLWSIDRSKPSFPALSVTILPITNSILVDKIVNYLKFGKGNIEFAKYYEAKILGEPASKPKYYDELIKVFKDYVVGNFTSDPTLETALVSIIRLIDDSSRATSAGKNNEIEFTYEYSRARAYMILKEIGALSEDLEDPTAWSRQLNLPGSGTSLMSDLVGSYYEYVENNITKQDIDEITSNVKVPTSIRLKSLESFNDDLATTEGKLIFDDVYNSDPLQLLREDFGDVPVYCIDSEDAHEIDDGISLHTEGDKYVVSVHVANPTSYLRPDSITSTIAFGKTSTTYTPERAYMMLPRLLSEISGLGVDGKEVRAFTVQYKLDKNQIDGHIKAKLENPNHETDASLIKQAIQEIDQSIDVKFVKVRNFPQNFTYNAVDSLLNDEAKLQNFKNNTSNDVHFDNLFKLHGIASLLFDVRLSGGATNLNSDLVTIKVVNGIDDSSLKRNVAEQLVAEDSNKTILLSRSSTNRDSKSIFLVTQHMIFANYSAAAFAHKNDIGFIYRGQELNLAPSVREELRSLTQRCMKANSPLSEEDNSTIISITTGAKFVTEPSRHESLGIAYYSNVTSPLRRYVDMINHWKIAEHLLRKSNIISHPMIHNHELRFIANYLQNGEIMNKQYQRASNKFWEAMLLKEIAKLRESGDKSFKFRLLIQTSPKLGDAISVKTLGLGHLNAKLGVSSRLLAEYNRGQIKVGSVLESEDIKITKLDFVENELMFEYN